MRLAEMPSESIGVVNGGDLIGSSPGAFLRKPTRAGNSLLRA